MDTYEGSLVVNPGERQAVIYPGETQAQFEARMEEWNNMSEDERREELEQQAARMRAQVLGNAAAADYESNQQ